MKDYQTIPNSLEECMADDYYAHELWQWSKRIKTYGRILFFILIIVGFILAVNSAMVTEYYQSYLGSINSREEFDVAVFFTVLITWSLYSFIEYCGYNAISLLLSALASIVQNVNTSTKVSIYVASNTVEMSNSKEDKLINEINEFKNLLDIGAITEDEYNKKVNELKTQFLDCE